MNGKLLLAACLFTFTLSWQSCTQKQTQQYFGNALQRACVQELTNVIVYDILNPPVASRMYAYSNLAYYEAIRGTDINYPSLLPRLKGFDTVSAPQPRRGYDYRLAAVTAFMQVAEKLVFSKDSIRAARERLLQEFGNLDKTVYQQSVQWGEKVAAVILQRAANDQYKITRGMPRFSVLKEKGIWQQTPPDYEEAAEPNWWRIQPLLLDSATQFAPPRPPAYSLDTKSQYHKELLELYQMSQALTPEQKLIARFWDDNPFVSEHKGHLTYANKKTTPVGHWMGISAILCTNANLTELQTAKAFALTSAAIFDGFISCWQEKYFSKTVRPVTVIRETIASEWNPLLQTPPFPEYTSGHSVISGAAARILAQQVGNKIAFRDTTELRYLGLERSFSSVEAAAEEVSISRMYGGIHYRSAVDNGLAQGRKIADLYNRIFP
ncbi:MAG: vanadium-dependent haloperoxidase [Chitinophagaceae bacterium]|nr:vanadium-dependent haloperoxidase [Chitinophagaceae bacterium]